MRTVFSGAGLAAVLFGALAAPASAAPSQPDSNLSRAVNASGAVATPGKAVTDLPSPASLNADEPSLCIRGHVQNIGWQGQNCQPAGRGPVVGTVDLSLRLEAIRASFKQKP